MNIEYWLSTADDDWLTVQTLFDSKRYLHCLFFAHLCIEKLIKAHWVKDNTNNIPPKIHHLGNLVKQTKLDLSYEQLKLLTIMNNYQLHGRYPEYRFKLGSTINKEYVEIIIPQNRK